MANRLSIVDLPTSQSNSINFHSRLDKVLHTLKMLEREAKGLLAESKKRIYIKKAERDRLQKIQNCKIIVVYDNKYHWSGLLIKDLADITEKGRKGGFGKNTPMVARPFIQNFFKSNAFKNIRFPKSMLNPNSNFNVIKRDIEDDINLKFYNWFIHQNTLAPLTPDYLERTKNQRKSPKPLRFTDNLIKSIHFKVVAK